MVLRLFKKIKELEERISILENIENVRGKKLDEIMEKTSKEFEEAQKNMRENLAKQSKYINETPIIK